MRVVAKLQSKEKATNYCGDSLIITYQQMH
jgi:hypothetical protein